MWEIVSSSFNYGIHYSELTYSFLSDIPPAFSKIYNSQPDFEKPVYIDSSATPEEDDPIIYGLEKTVNSMMYVFKKVEDTWLRVWTSSSDEKQLENSLNTTSTDNNA